ncbi:P27 family phage terminase small subunit [Jeotgalibacillus proteolyticus]|uniref:Terminase n=1 Tax=Jeotgalibacillus proteolyticus TaxID=2082395 RepID=A0A2S5GFZ7_9BACL|nr:P27 family phage terminase small subunit [Jeotgalibacillus proteolyticus]PPA71916.1 terminase [Jeotgalibacillus proteolyticus]
MSKIPTKETIKRKTIEDMKALKVHKPQYNRLITIYAELMHQYLLLNKQFEDEGYQYESSSAAGSAKKSPIVATLEGLRKDILAYSDRLCLNPKSAIDSKGNGNDKTSGLAKILSGLD